MSAQFQILAEKVKSLPKELQDNIALFWEQDIKQEIGFDEKLYSTADKLKLIADKAVREYKAGKAVEKGIDEL